MWWELFCWRCSMMRVVCQEADPTRLDSNGHVGRDPCPNCGSLWVTAEACPELEFEYGT